MQYSFVDKPIYFYDHREESALTSVNQYVLIRLLYQEVVTMVKKFPKLQPELNNREYWSYIAVHDKLIFANNKQLLRKKRI